MARKSKPKKIKKVRPVGQTYRPSALRLRVRQIMEDNPLWGLTELSDTIRNEDPLIKVEQVLHAMNAEKRRILRFPKINEFHEEHINKFSGRE